jgi:hypothetical protein
MCVCAPRTRRSSPALRGWGHRRPPPPLYSSLALARALDLLPSLILSSLYGGRTLLYCTAALVHTSHRRRGHFLLNRPARASFFAQINLCRSVGIDGVGCADAAPPPACLPQGWFVFSQPPTRYVRTDPSRFRGVRRGCFLYVCVLIAVDRACNEPISGLYDSI